MWLQDRLLCNRSYQPRISRALTLLFLLFPPLLPFWKQHDPTWFSWLPGNMNLGQMSFHCVPGDSFPHPDKSNRLGFQGHQLTAVRLLDLYSKINNRLLDQEINNLHSFHLLFLRSKSFN